MKPYPRDGDAGGGAPRPARPVICSHDQATTGAIQPTDGRETWPASIQTGVQHLRRQSAPGTERRTRSAGRRDGD